MTETIGELDRGFPCPRCLEPIYLDSCDYHTDFTKGMVVTEDHDEECPNCGVAYECKVTGSITYEVRARSKEPSTEEEARLVKAQAQSRKHWLQLKALAEHHADDFARKIKDAQAEMSRATAELRAYREMAS